MNTEEKLIQAFQIALSKKDYNDLTIQDILNETTVSRSTFYAHYKTKEDLLNSICKNIFHHVFSHSLKEEENHDFSKSSAFDYKHFVTHIFYHIKEEKVIINTIFSNKSKWVFVHCFKNEIAEFAQNIEKNSLVMNKKLPEDLKIKSIINSFVNLLEYWVENKFNDTPEELTNYFILLNN